MKRALAFLMLVAALVILVGHHLLVGQSTVAKSRRIAVFGSSVAYGTGDERGKEGYTGRLRTMLAPAGWEVLNRSRPGDNTLTIASRFAPSGQPLAGVRYLLPVSPAYVLLGLSLGNEGIANASNRSERDTVYRQFEAGMKGLVERSRQHLIVPVMALCYTRNDFTAVEYEYTRRMNLAINSWDVPSVNFLGAVDDGAGRWPEGFWSDSLHPNAAGHDELAATFVPTLFEALERGKARPTKSTAPGFARASGGPALTFSPGGTMHPFAMVMTVRTRLDGPVATITGTILKSPMLTRTGAFTAVVGATNGRFTYSASNSHSIVSDTRADGNWHQIVVSHYTARGESLFFVDGKLAGRTVERLEPTGFAIGGRPADGGEREIDLKDVLIYRAALNEDEVAALSQGTLLQASLDVFAPLRESMFTRGSAVENRAQSLAALTVGSGLSHVER